MLNNSYETMHPCIVLNFTRNCLIVLPLSMVVFNEFSFKLRVSIKLNLSLLRFLAKNVY